MTLPDRLNAFAYLGHDLRRRSKDDLETLAKRAHAENEWFTEDSVSMAFTGIDTLLNEERLRSWVSNYTANQPTPKTIGVAMAGNIPLVGFHDFLTVLISGHRLKYKPSSKDSVLLNFIVERLLESEPRFADMISCSNSLRDVDAVIATGSDNSARYFEYYFRSIPHIIRKNRVSCAIIKGDEPPSEIERLGHDIFSYYGLGCRNVSTLYVPEETELKKLMEVWRPFESVMRNPKYANNYLYQKSLALINKEKSIDGGFVLLKENGNLVSPIATLYYETYQHLDSLKERIAKHVHKIQVLVSAQGWFEESLPFGSSQKPLVTDYADGIDTLKFLMELDK